MVRTKPMLLIAALGAAAVALVALRRGSGGRPGVDGRLPADLVVPDAPVLTAAQQLETFRVQEGYEVQLVAAEPLVVDPVHISYDERGRLWVCEMRGYMQDADGRGQNDPVGRIAVLTDVDGDGVMDERAEFADGLVLPRGVLPMDGGALCVLPPELVFLRDEDGDGVHDVREVVADGFTAGLENPEYEINSPTLGIDNWVRFANWDHRVRRTRDDEGAPVWEVERTRGGGQWGLGVDELGRFYRNTNGSPLYVDVSPDHYGMRNRHPKFFAGFMAGVEASEEVFPSRVTPGVNRGYERRVTGEDWTLKSYTSACAPTPMTGDAMGKDARGDAFVAEPAAHLVKRYRMEAVEGSAGLRATSEHARYDFWTSTDERFRPVAMTNGPDGALHVADMCRGVIQHHAYMTGFLRRQVDDRGLAGPAGLGRVWRVVEAGTAPRSLAAEAGLAEAPLLDLVGQLGSASAWVRRQAQRVLVEDFEGERSVVQALRAAALDPESPWAALHALWTLEGIGHTGPDTLLRAFDAPDPRVRAAAFEIAGPTLDLEGSEQLFEPLVARATSDPDPRARLHALLAVGGTSRDALLEVYAERMERDASSPFERAAVLSGLEFRERDMLDLIASREAWKQPTPGQPELLVGLAACTGKEALPANVARVLELALTPPAAWWSRPLVDGLILSRDQGPDGVPLPLALPAAPTGLDLDARPEPGSLAARIAEGFTWPGKPDAPGFSAPRSLTPDERLRYERGGQVYRAACASCHQAHGGGERGKAPTLRGTPYVVGEADTLVRILLHGLTGPLEVDGHTWNQDMPRFEGSDAELAAVATFIRRSWGNGAEPIAIGEVENLRSSAERRALTASDLVER